VSVPGPADAATITAASCSQVDVQAAINSANNGDTVMIPNGSCTWTGGINVGKQIWIRAQNYTPTPGGNANRNVTITASNSSSPLFRLTTGDSYHVGISGIRFNEGNRTNNYIEVNGSGSKVALLSDLLFEVKSMYGNSRDIAALDWPAQGGVIWNTRFVGLGTGGVQGVGADGASFVIKGSPRVWYTPSTMGSRDTNGTVNIYLEDSSCLNVGQFPDVDDHGRVVFRHNNIDGCSGLTHGFTSTWGGRHAEYYDNTFSVTNSQRNHMGRYFWVRAGTVVFTDNVINNAANTQAYGSVAPFSIGDNTSPKSYPQLRQPGWGHDGTKAVIDPIYQWNNTGARGTAFGGFQNGWDSIVQMNREVFVNSGAKPGYQKYAYPHPARVALGSQSAPPPLDAAPTVALTAPADGATVSGTIAVSANASDDVGVAGVQFSLDGAPLGVEDSAAPYSVLWNTAAVGNGPHSLTAVARDTSGNTTSSAPRTVNVANSGATAPSITSQPQNATVSVGQTATFSVGAAGSAPLSYQWQRNGTNIIGATGSSYTTPPAATSDNGSSYRVIVTNGAGTVTSASATLTVSSQAGPVPSDSYNFNEGSGTTAADSSGGNRPGTLVNGPTWVAGKNGGALRFDGTNDYVTIGSRPLSATFTLSAWVNNPQNNVYETIASFGSYRQFSISYGYLAFWDGNGSEYRFGAMPAGSWQHVAFSYDGSTLRAYLNGAPLGTPLTRSIPATSGETLFGAWPRSSSVREDLLSGSLDDIRIYDRALTQTEIQADGSRPVGSTQAAATLVLGNVSAPKTAATDGAKGDAAKGDAAEEGGHPAAADGIDLSLPILAVASEAEAGGEWTYIDAASGFDDAVIIAGAPSVNEAQPGVVRLSNVSGSGFDMRFQEWDYLQRLGAAAHAAEKIPYAVLQPGRHRMGDGTVWEVGSFPIAGGASWQHITFSEPFEGAPSVFLTVQTANDPRAVTVRARGITGEGFDAALLQEEAQREGHGAETIGYLAVRRETAGGVIDMGGETVPYMLQSVVANDRWVPVLSQRLKLEEEQSKDMEVHHPDESIDVLALGRHLFAQQVSDTSADPTAVRRLPPLDAPAMEWGLARGVDSSWTVLPLAKSYTNPVIVARSVSAHDPAPGVVRLRQVAPDRLELRFQEWNDAGARHGKEDTFYMVAEAGRQALGDLAVEAGALADGPSGGDGWQRVAFSGGFAEAPVVLSAVQTANAAQALSARVANVTPSSFLATLDPRPDQGNGSAAERIGWIALERGRSAIVEGRTVQAFSDEIDGAFGPVRFPTATEHRHPTVVSDINGGLDPTPVFLRHANPASTQIRLRIARPELAGTAAVWHQPENAGLFVGE
jgi:hypothetical protein